MKLRIFLVGLLILVMAPLLVSAADDEEPKLDLTKEEVQALLADRTCQVDVITSISDSRVAFAEDSSYRLTSQTRYYSSTGIKLSRLNFHAGDTVKYCLVSTTSVGLMIKK